MKKNPSWERSKNASRSSGVLSWVDSGTAAGIESPGPENVDDGSHKEGAGPRTRRGPLTTGLRSARSCRSVNRTLVGVGSGIPERHRVAVVGPAHHPAVPEDPRY